MNRLPHGTQFHPSNNLLTSSGHPIIDKLLKGGIQIGSLVGLSSSIYEQYYTDILGKLFLSQGVYSRHQCIIVGDFVGESDLYGLSVGEGSEEKVGEKEEVLKIAWRYQKQQTNEEVSSSTRGSGNGFIKNKTTVPLHKANQLFTPSVTTPSTTTPPVTTTSVATTTSNTTTTYNQKQQEILPYCHPFSLSQKHNPTTTQNTHPLLNINPQTPKEILEQLLPYFQKYHVQSTYPLETRSILRILIHQNAMIGSDIREVVRVLTVLKSWCRRSFCVVYFVHSTGTTTNNTFTGGSTTGILNKILDLNIHTKIEPTTNTTNTNNISGSVKGILQIQHNVKMNALGPLDGLIDIYSLKSTRSRLICEKYTFDVDFGTSDKGSKSGGGRVGGLDSGGKSKEKGGSGKSKEKGGSGSSSKGGCGTAVEW